MKKLVLIMSVFCLFLIVGCVDSQTGVVQEEETVDAEKVSMQDIDPDAYFERNRQLKKFQDVGFAQAGLKLQYQNIWTVSTETFSPETGLVSTKVYSDEFYYDKEPKPRLRITLYNSQAVFSAREGDQLVNRMSVNNVMTEIYKYPTDVGGDAHYVIVEGKNGYWLKVLVDQYDDSEESDKVFKGILKTIQSL
ncbi:hypothetical protein HQ571_00480 [Candidatus Kuenenbacteria bacterium]|nr:hypothetical protein [Candidatus Kuenenbacteria bacterium]